MSNPITPGYSDMPCGASVPDTYVDLHVKDCDLCQQVNAGHFKKFVSNMKTLRAKADDSQDGLLRSLVVEISDDIAYLVYGTNYRSLTPDQRGKIAIGTVELAKKTIRFTRQPAPKTGGSGELATLRDMLAEFADEPYRQREYKIIEFLQANYIPRSEVEEALNGLESSLPNKDGDKVDLQFGTFEQIKASSIAVQDNGKLMAVKEIRAKLGLGKGA